MIRWSNEIYPSKIALPMIMSLVAFPSINEQDSKKSSNKRTIWSWFTGSKNVEQIANSNNQTANSTINPLSPPILSPPLPSNTNITSPNNNDPIKPLNTKKYRKQLRPSSEILKNLNLISGKNTITYVVHSRLQGTQTISASIYLWPADSRIVITDVDGTITRSDFLGSIWPLMGKDWSHNGVAPFFSAVNKNGYRIVYLSARAIGQSQITKSVIESITQIFDNKENKLPDGPLLLAPDSVMLTFKREIIDKTPQEFKIVALRNLRSLFPTTANPLYAGFGNHDTDNVAYRKVDIPPQRIFSINSTGTIDIESTLNSNMKTSYVQLTSMVDLLFPPLTAICYHETQGYDERSFWKNSYGSWLSPEDIL